MTPTMHAVRDQMVATPDRPSRSRALGIASGTSVLTFLACILAPPPVAAVIALVLVLASPTSDRLSRRLVVNLVLLSLVLVVLGWVPGHGVQIWLALALASGALAWWCAHHGCRVTLPRMEPADTIPPLAGLVGLSIAWPLLGTTPTSAMALLMGGWDHVSHFSMYLAQREGVSQAVPTGETWLFGNYPQLFHALMARLADLTWGAPGAPAAELVHYSTIQAVLYVGVVVFGVAVAVEATARSRKAAQVTAGALAASLFLGYPGSSLLTQGYLSVLWSIVAAVVVITIARRPNQPSAVDLVVAATCVVAVAAWPLLLPTVAYPSIHLLRRGWRAGRSHRQLVGGLGLAAFVACAWLAWVSGRVDPTGHIVTAGGIAHTGAIASFAVPAVVLVSAVVGIRSGHAASWRPLLWSAAACLVLVTAIALFQAVEAGELSYYFWKTALGYQTILLGVVVPDIARAICTLVGRVTTTTHGTRTITALIAGGTAALGLGTAAGQASVSTGLIARWSMESWAAQTALATEVIAMSTTPVALSTAIWAKESDAYAPALPDQWLHSFTRTRTVAVDRYETTLNDTRHLGRDALADAAVGVLRGSTLTVLVDDPVVYQRMLTDLGPDARERVLLVR